MVGGDDVNHVEAWLRVFRGVDVVGALVDGMLLMVMFLVLVALGLVAISHVPAAFLELAARLASIASTL